MIKKQTQNAAVHIWRIIHTIRVKILGLELSLWLVINKGLGRFVLTPDSCLQPLCEGKIVRTTIRRPSFLLLPCVPHPFLVSLKVSTLEDSIQTPPFPYNLPWPEQGSLKNLFSKPPAPGLLAQINQHKAAVLQCFLSGFLDFLKGILIIHFSYVYVLPLLDLRGTVHWFDLSLE